MPPLKENVFLIMNSSRMPKTVEWKNIMLQQSLVAAVKGFQGFVDDHSGFGQFAADVVAELREDYSTAPVLVSPVRPTHAPLSQAQVGALTLLHACYPYCDC